MMGALQGIRDLEFAGIGPVPFCAMMLSDAGADVIRVDRRAEEGPDEAPDLFHPGRFGVTNRGRRSVAFDLKKPGAVDAILRLVQSADVLIEGFRPGVMERLGLGPEVCLARNPRLVYGRMTGWGQEGPLASVPGHDINYIAIAGALHAVGRAGEPPVPPLNLVGDFGGGAMMLAFGVLCGLLQAQRSGKGQVVDAAMSDGAALLMALMYGLKAQGLWSNERGANLFDGGAHFYGTFECADGRSVAVGALEPQFYDVLLRRCGFDDPRPEEQLNATRWRELRERLATVFRSKTRQEWCDLLYGTDACFAPVLDLDEAPEDPHNRARAVFVEVAGVVQPAPAPRFSRTPSRIQGPPPRAGEHTEAVLREFGFAEPELRVLAECGVI
ncbi:MAG: CoA transferase [Deltaproteobacteria bacterium]|nr:CoA transferase [Deltaproteobacteria bacterium]